MRTSNLRWSGRAASLIAAIGIIARSHVQAEDLSWPKCDGAVGAAQFTKCFDDAFDAADKRLNAIYGLIMNMFDAGAADPKSAFFYDKKRNLVTAERAWARFRDAQCSAEAGMLSQASASGEAAATGECLVKMTRERTAYLEEVASSIKADSKLCEKAAGACEIN
jgi:uncharacterized protein YecT (DUF1311 family)